MMTILGLTGSIGMGKSEAAKAFRARGIPVFDADATVHDLFQNDEDLQDAIAARFDGVVIDHQVDRQKLARAVFGDDAALNDLEKIVHPAVGSRRLKFLLECEKNREKLVVLDVPLLFETEGESICDKVAVVSAPFEVQKERVMARPDMTEERFESILNKQMPDEEKRARADYIIPTGEGFQVSEAKIDEIIAEIKAAALA